MSIGVRDKRPNINCKGMGFKYLPIPWSDNGRRRKSLIEELGLDNRMVDRRDNNIVTYTLKIAIIRLFVEGIR